MDEFVNIRKIDEILGILWNPTNLQIGIHLGFPPLWFAEIHDDSRCAREIPPEELVPQKYA